MNAVEFAKMNLESSRNWALGLISDMHDAALTQPTPNGGNHPLWIVGHLAFSESQLLDSFVRGKDNRHADLKPLFDSGTSPSEDANQYPPMDQLLEKWESIRSDVLAHLDSLSDSDLDQPSHAPQDFAAFFGTVGQCFSAMAVHVAFHAGQVADARRAAGRPPLMG